MYRPLKQDVIIIQLMVEISPQHQELLEPRHLLLDPAKALTAIVGLDFVSSNNSYLGFCRVQQQVSQLQ